MQFIYGESAEELCPWASKKLNVINKSRLIFPLTIDFLTFRLTIDRDAANIYRDAANIYRDASQHIIGIWKHIDVNSFISLID